MKHIVCFDWLLTIISGFQPGCTAICCSRQPHLCWKAIILHIWKQSNLNFNCHYSPLYWAVNRMWPQPKRLPCQIRHFYVQVSFFFSPLPFSTKPHCPLYLKSFAEAITVSSCRVVKMITSSAVQPMKFLCRIAPKKKIQKVDYNDDNDSTKK